MLICPYRPQRPLQTREGPSGCAAYLTPWSLLSSRKLARIEALSFWMTALSSAMVLAARTLRMNCLTVWACGMAMSASSCPASMAAHKCRALRPMSERGEVGWRGSPGRQELTRSHDVVAVHQGPARGPSRSPLTKPLRKALSGRRGMLCRVGMYKYHQKGGGGGRYTLPAARCLKLSRDRYVEGCLFWRPSAAGAAARGPAHLSYLLSGSLSSRSQEVGWSLKLVPQISGTSNLRHRSSSHMQVVDHLQSSRTTAVGQGRREPQYRGRVPHHTDDLDRSRINY